MGIISLAIGRLDHILIAGPMQTLKTEQQARTPVRLNHLHLTPQEEEDGRARLLMPPLTGTMTIHRKMETIITTKVNLTALAIIARNLPMAGLLTEVATLVAVIEGTFQTKVPIGDFLALALIHTIMDPHNAAREVISTTCNGLLRDHEAVGDNIVLTRRTWMGHKLPVDRSPTMNRNHPEPAKVNIIIPGPPLGMKR